VTQTKIFPSLLAVSLAAASVLISSNPGLAQAGVEAESRQFRVLDSQEVDLGSRSIIYNRVETPVLKPQPPTVEKLATPVVEYVPTAEELEEMRRWEVMNHVSLFLSCTVYDDQITQVRFRHGDVNVTFWSTVNFHYLSQLGDLQTRDTYYLFMMGVDDSTKKEFEEENAELLREERSDLLSAWPSNLAAPTSSNSAWQITSKGPGPAEALKFIEDIHAYFDANRNALVTARVEREAAWAAREQWLKENPPQPKDTVIQFFPIRSSHSPTEARVLKATEAVKASRE
jgi:hypothetical protein